MKRLRDAVTTIAELAGLALIAKAGFDVSEALGWFLSGAALLGVGYAAGRS